MKLFGQVLFWLLVILLLTLLFGSSDSNYTESFYFVAMLLPVIVGTSYFFNDYLVPRYLFKRRLFKFILYALYMLIISAWLEILVIMLAFVMLANYQYKNMNPVSTNVFVLAVTLYCIVLLYGFILLVLRSFRHQKRMQKLEEEIDKQKNDFLIVRAERKMNKIPRDEIEYLESLGDYVKIITSSGAPLITKEKISKLAEKLPDSFLRIHRSYIVNSNKIQAYNKEGISLKDNTQLPISRTYKKKVMDVLGKVA